MTSQKFWQWGDDINTNDGITPFDGIKEINNRPYEDSHPMLDVVYNRRT